ncbi:MAG: hypothetical protein HWE27_11710 [Gammaproteobacteria bacterium]|nr:hypothetical protein [Gammaproteobacteria bacterium]
MSLNQRLSFVLSFLCISLPLTIQAQEHVKLNHIIVQPNESFEHCALLQKNSKRNLSFSASEPLYFSFSNKSSDLTSYLIAEHLTPKMKNVPLVIMETKNYCLTWKNRQQVAVELTWQLVEQVIEKRELN